MRNQVLFTLSTLALLIHPLSLSAQNSYSISLDVNSATGDQAVRSVNVSADEVVAIQIFGKDIQNANGLAVRFEYNATQVVYESFEASNVLPSAQALPEQGTNPTFVKISIASFGGQATVNSGLVGTIRFRTLAAFSGTEIRLVRAELGRGGQIESMTLNLRVALQLQRAVTPDFDGDGRVGFSDFLAFAGRFGSRQGDGTYEARYDLDSDGAIGFSDFLTFSSSFGKEVSPLTGQAGDNSDRFLYTKHDSDPSWSSILEEKQIPIGTNSYTGITGSIIDVNNDVVEKGPHAFRPIESEINIHTLGNSLIPRRDFHKWSRWYQEDGNTQVFRLFDGEHNVRNARANAARIEAFSTKRWNRGTWHEWIGTYTIVKAQRCAIFQVKNNGEDWSIQLVMTADGDVVFQPRRATSKTVLKNMEGKSFDVRIRDNGHTSECYINGEFAGRHDWERPSGRSTFRWGMYVGGTRLSKDALLFVTGATVDPEKE